MVPAVFAEDDGTEEYEVEDIVGSRLHRNKTEYLVKWVGYPMSECTWEPESNLTNAPEIVARF